MAEEYRIIKITTNTGGGITDSAREDMPSTAVTFTVSGLTVSQNLNVSGHVRSDIFSGKTGNAVYYGDGSNLANITTGIETITVGENVVSGDLLYLNTDGKYWKASNTDEATSSTELRLATVTILADTSGNAISKGQYTTTGLSTGATYWVGTGGAYSASQPSGDGNIVRYVGTPLSDTVLEFNPDETYIEITTGSAVVAPSQPSLRNVTASEAILTTDYTVNVTTTGDTTQTLPTAVGVQGKIYNIKNSDSTEVGVITMDTTSSQTIDTLWTSVAGGNPISFQYPDSLSFQSDGSNWILI